MKIQSLFLVLFSMLTLSACQSEKAKAREEITRLEKAVEANPNPADAAALLKSYQDYVAQYPEDAANNPRYLYRAAALEFRQNHFSSAVNHLVQAIDNYYASENTPQAMLFLGELYQDNLRNEESAITVFQALAKAFPDSEPGKKAGEKLPDSLPAIPSRLETMAVQMFNDSTRRFEYRIVNNYIASGELYAMLMPNEADAPDVLYEAADAARSIRSFTKALKLYEKINTRYPEYERAPLALFMRAFTLDSDLKRFDESKVLYEAFLAQYPAHDFADDAQAGLDNLGKTDEEILRNLEEKSKAKAAEAGNATLEKAEETE